MPILWAALGPGLPSNCYQAIHWQCQHHASHSSMGMWWWSWYVNLIVRETFQCLFPAFKKELANDKSNLIFTCVADELRKEYSEPSECKMITSLCKKPLDIWSLGMLGTCIDAPAAFRFGKSSFKLFVFEVGFEFRTKCIVIIFNHPST